MIAHSRPTITISDVEAISSCLRAEMINEGRRVADVERYFIDKFKAQDAVATGSGSQALLLCLKAVGVSAHSEVIVPSYLCAEVLAVIEDIGAIAVICDVEEDYLLGYQAAAAAVTERTKAIVFPYLMGKWRDVRPFKSLGVPVIEDCAQFLVRGDEGFGALHGDLAFFSFEATKIVTAGEGGLALVRNPIYSIAVRSQKQLSDTPYKRNLFPLSDLQAALLKSQLSRLDSFLERRRMIANRYMEALADCSTIEFPNQAIEKSVFFRLPLQVRNSTDRKLDEYIGVFAAAGISVRRPVDRLLQHLRSCGKSLPVAEHLYRHTLSLPLYPGLQDEELAKVVATAQEIFSGRLGNLSKE